MSCLPAKFSNHDNAQTMNVLQAMILTDKEKMLLTSTHRVFEMFSAHQDTTQVPVDSQSENYSVGEYSVPALSASASSNAVAQLHLTISKSTPQRNIPVTVSVRDMKTREVFGCLLREDRMDAQNTSEEPKAVQPVELTGARISAGGIDITVPKMSVVVLEAM